MKRNITHLLFVVTVVIFGVFVALPALIGAGGTESALAWNPWFGGHVRCDIDIVVFHVRLENSEPVNGPSLHYVIEGLQFNYRREGDLNGQEIFEEEIRTSLNGADAGIFTAHVVKDSETFDESFEFSALTCVEQTPSATPEPPTSTPEPPTVEPTNTPEPTETQIPPTSTPPAPTEPVPPSAPNDLYCEVRIENPQHEGKEFIAGWTDMQSAFERIWAGIIANGIARIRVFGNLDFVGKLFAIRIDDIDVQIFTIDLIGDRVVCRPLPTPTATPASTFEAQSTSQSEPDYDARREEIRIRCTEQLVGTEDPVCRIDKPQSGYDVESVEIVDADGTTTVVPETDLCEAYNGNATLVHWNRAVSEGAQVRVTLSDNVVISSNVTIVDGWQPATVVDHVCSDGRLLAMPGETVSHVILMLNISWGVENRDELLHDWMIWNLEVNNGVETLTIVEGRWYSLPDTFFVAAGLPVPRR